jgi:hypothetical protein
MSKKRTKSPAPKPADKQADAAYLGGQGGGAGILKTPGQSAEAAQPVTSAASSKPPTPVSALWPDAIPATGNSKPAHTHIGETKTTQVTATPPKVPPAPEPAPPNPPVLSTPPTLPQKPAIVAQAPKSKPVTVSFALLEPNAKRVALCGDFNGWSPSATPMKRDKDGHWAKTVSLAPGRYQYKFVVDGQWMPDPQAHESVWNYHGTLNSVLEVPA